MAEGSSRSESQDVHDLVEPLLDHGDSNVKSSAKSKARGCDTVTPYENAGFFRILTFSWISPLLALGVEKTSLDLDDIPQLGTMNSVLGAFPVFRSKLLDVVVAATVSGRGVTTKFGLAKAMFLTAWKDIILTGFMGIISTLARYVGPYLIDSFVQSLNGRGKFQKQGYILALIFCGATIIQVLVQKHMSFKLQQVGIRIRGSTMVMIYNKCMPLSSQSTSIGGGELMNVVAVDVETINGFIRFMHDPWLIFLQIGLALLILYKNLGLVASVAALAVAIGFMLVNSVFATWQERFQNQLMKSKDDRMKVTMETIRNMRILKFQGWEMSFLSKILQLRKIEMQWLKKFLYSSGMLSFFVNVSPMVVAFVTFGSCIFMGIPLETGKILAALATFQVLQSPIYLLPDTISILIQTKVSLGRIASFLSLDELHPHDTLEKLPLGSSDTAIEIVGGNFIWDNSSLPPTSATLKDINFKVSHGMKVAICGTVGSGKSSLLSCILGEIPKISGAVKLCGAKAYVAQSPWIQSGTIQENILFGKEMDAERYDKVLEACCLKKDLEILSFGDQTIIGERGINLSGGQKQRIQIARAIYYDADIYLFDDPFSAVDAHTGSHLFKEVLLGLLSGKTIVYVTHQVEFLNAADLIMVMKDGRISQVGKYDDNLIPESDFMKLVGAQKAALSVLGSDMASRQDNESLIRDDIINNGIVLQEEGNKAVQNGCSQPVEQLIKEEERERGSVGFAVYWKYITTAYGGSLFLLVVLGHLLSDILQLGSSYWLAWATPMSKDVKPVVDGSTLILVFVSLAIGMSFCAFAVGMLLATAVYKTAIILFKKMLRNIFRAPMSFFDATPSGRILNRCSKDQTAVETQIPSVLDGFVECTTNLMVIVVVMASVAWQVLLIFVPVLLASIWYQQYYMASSRELTRLSGVCQAPVIQYFAETISGLTTIRGFDQESRFQATYMNLVDAYSRPEFNIAAAMKWLTLRLDALSSVTFACLLVLVVYFAEDIDPAIAGLAVTYALTLQNTLVGFIWCLSHSQNKMISVERILQYMSTPNEAPLTIESNKPDCSWPSDGEISIYNLQVRYAPYMPLVLKGLTCTFPGGLKTGIVGRTGSGKSTLIQALFRIVEPTVGQVLIDDVDILSIGLQDLRSKLSIIPQDPTMFQGTIRSNLDPLEMYTDAQIWETLDKCQLGDEVRKMELKLDSYVNENGENWSMGQRQLVCLGRVLLKKSKILVLDEATASVDTATDNLIQQTLKHHFAHCTIITIAHRISSILDSNMVLFLNQGRIEEYDTPGRLLQNNKSSFAQLVAEYTTRS